MEAKVETKVGTVASWAAGLLVSATLLAAGPAATASSFGLVGQELGGFGQHGLWLGPEDWSHSHSRWLNWRFADVTLTVSDDGDASLWGSMTRLGDEERYPELDLEWGIHIELQDLFLTGDVFDGRGGAYAGMVDDLLASGEDGAGLEWGSLTMALVIPDGLPYDTNVPATGWTGLAMPDEGHLNVAELHYDQGVGLTFEAWYQNPDSDSHYHRVGDTKARVPAVPEPAAALLFCVGCALVGSASARRRA